MKSTWNYRLMLDELNGEKIFSLNDVYYDDGETPSDYTKMPETMISNDTEELIFKIEGFLRAFEEPILSIQKFPSEVHDHEDL